MISQGDNSTDIDAPTGGRIVYTTPSLFRLDADAAAGGATLGAVEGGMGPSGTSCYSSIS